MSDIFIVGICARRSGKYSGKDTFADAFIQRFRQITDGEIRIAKRSLADPLKAAAVEIFRLKPEQVYGRNGEKEELTQIDWPEHNDLGRSGKMTAREILQYLATQVMRYKFGEDVWVKSLNLWVAEEFSKDPSKHLVVVVPDIRFLNEAQIADVLVDVYRPRLQEQYSEVEATGQQAEASLADIHVSETAGMSIPDSKVEFFATNDKTEMDLKLLARSYADEFVDKHFKFLH